MKRKYDEVKMNYEWTANRICGGLFVYIWGRQRAIVRKNQGKKPNPKRK